MKLHIKNFNIRFLLPLVFLPVACWAQITDNSDVLQVVVNFATKPSTYTVEKAPLKYNKTFAFSFQEDDDNKDIYTHAFQYLNGGMIGGVVYPGLSFTDGCGNIIKYRMSSSTSSFSWFDSTDIHDPNGAYQNIATTWPEINEMYSFKWGISNHGLTSDVGNYAYSIARDHSYIKRMTQLATPGGIDMGVFVNTNGDINYSAPAFDQGYLVCYRQAYDFGNPSFDVNSVWDHNDIKMGRTFLSSNRINLSAIVDSMASSSKNGARHWGVVFTHSITDSASGYDFTNFKLHMNYLANKYGKSGLDNMWMTTEEEVLDYLLVNNIISINAQLNNNRLVITISGDVPTKYRFYATSLLLEADAIIESIEISDALDYSYNGTGTSKSLINLSWSGKVLVPPQQPAETWVSKAELTQSQDDVNIAVDYVMMVPAGPEQAAFRSRLCAIPQKKLPDNFCTTGVASGEALHFILFPNPAKNEFTIEFPDNARDEKRIALFDRTGKCLFRKLSAESRIQLNLGEYPCGIYHLIIETAGLIYTREIVRSE